MSETCISVPMSVNIVLSSIVMSGYLFTLLQLTVEHGVTHSTCVCVCY